MSGLKRIAEERVRQIAKEGWSAMHDDAHDSGSLAAAAACYAALASLQACGAIEACGASPRPPQGWPWELSDWKPKDRMRNLVRAGALIAAEIDRLERAEKGAR